MSKYVSRKFIVVAAFTLTGCLAFLCWDDKLTGAEFVALALGLGGLFTAGDVALNAVHKKNSE